MLKFFRGIALCATCIFITTSFATTKVCYKINNISPKTSLAGETLNIKSVAYTSNDDLIITTQQAVTITVSLINCDGSTPSSTISQSTTQATIQPAIVPSTPTSNTNNHNDEAKVTNGGQGSIPALSDNYQVSSDDTMLIITPATTD
ncbi:MAG: hypothetical protein KAS93_03880 [Gammaproteobacteria bacterium]|nr:hypothetical protein [Gammaproteobacteria bacterium]